MANGQGKLRYGRRQFGVEILEQSAGGFGVRAPSDTPLDIGQNWLLDCEIGTIEVRVVHVASEPEGLVAGLQRLNEFAPHSAAPGRWWAGLSVAACLVFFVAGLVCPLRLGHRPPPMSEEMAGLLRLPREEREKWLAASFRQLDRLNSAGLSQRLSLANEQKSAVDNAVASASLQLAALFESSDQRTDWTEPAVQVLVSSFRDIRTALDPEQRAQLDALLLGETKK